MNTRLYTTLLATVLLTGTAFAGNRDHRDHRDNRYDNHNRHQPVQLSLSIEANGTQRIPLKKLIRRQYDIDLDAYRIRTVRIRNKARHACADLQVGHSSTGPVDLYRGVTTLRAPRGGSDGRWALHVEDARVRWISVELVPRRGYASRDYHRGNERRYDRRSDGAYRDTYRRGLAFDGRSFKSRVR